MGNNHFKNTAGHLQKNKSLNKYYYQQKSSTLNQIHLQAITQSSNQMQGRVDQRN